MDGFWERITFNGVFQEAQIAFSLNEQVLGDNVLPRVVVDQVSFHLGE